MAFGTRLFKRKTLLDLTVKPDINRIVEKNRRLRKDFKKKNKPIVVKIKGIRKRFRRGSRSRNIRLR